MNHKKFCSISFLTFLFRFFDDKDAEFPEEVDGDGDEGEGEGVAGGGDDGADDEDDNDGVATVVAHEGALEDAELGQEPAEDGELEDDTHEECHDG